MKFGPVSDRGYTEHDEYFLEFYPRLDGSMEPFDSYRQTAGEMPPLATLLPSSADAWSHFICSVADYARKTPGDWLYSRIAPEFHALQRSEWTHPDALDPRPWPLEGDVGYRVYCRFLISEKEPSDAL